MLTEFGSEFLVELADFYLCCGSPKPSRRDADDPLEVKGKFALIREADALSDFAEAEVVITAHELLGPFNTSCDYILMRRQPGRRFKLPSKVIGTDMND